MDNNFWKSELKKCSLDRTRAYMMSKYIFRKPLWGGQVKLLNAMLKRDLTLSIKSRNVGYTSLMAAFTACEMVLNYDIKRLNGKTHIVYIAPFASMRHLFLKQVQEYIEMLPEELWVTNDCPRLLEIHKCSDSGLYLELGEVKLMATDAGTVGFKNSSNKLPSYVIYDEMVIQNDDFDFNSSEEENWRKISDKTVIGGNPNHRNEKFYNFAKEYKAKYGDIVEMQFEDNPNNKWNKISPWDRMYSDTHEFADEFKCEIFKLVKETL